MAAISFWPNFGEELTVKGGDHLEHAGEEEDWNTGYGLETVTHGQHEWRIKIIKSAYSNADITIGVSSSIDHTDSGFVLHDEEDILSYGYCGFNGKKYDYKNKSKYAEHFEEGDVIGIRLDIDQGLIAFSRNSRYLGIAFSNIPTQNRQWRLAVSLCWKNDEVQRLSYVNLTNIINHNLDNNDDDEKNSKQFQYVQSVNNADDAIFVAPQQPSNSKPHKKKVYNNHIEECKDILMKQMNVMEDRFNEDKIKQMRVKHMDRNKTYLSNLKQDIESLQVGLKELTEKVTESERLMAECMAFETDKYEMWDIKMIEVYLHSLENGRYRKYIDGLLHAFEEDEITADNLPELDRADLRAFGISNFEDRKDLLEQFKKLNSVDQIIGSTQSM